MLMDRAFPRYENEAKHFLYSFLLPKKTVYLNFIQATIDNPPMCNFKCPMEDNGPLAI